MGYEIRTSRIFGVVLGDDMASVDTLLAPILGPEFSDEYGSFEDEAVAKSEILCENVTRNGMFVEGDLRLFKFQQSDGFVIVFGVQLDLHYIKPRFGSVPALLDKCDDPEKAKADLRAFLARANIPGEPSEHVFQYEST